MRNEKGYFCLVRGLSTYPEEEILFGPKKNETPGMENQGYENIVSNGLKFFPVESDAKEVLDELKNKPGAKDVNVGHIEIVIAETREEVEQLRQAENIVVLNATDLGTQIIGPNTSNNDRSSIYPIDGELLTINGGVPFAHYSSAEWTLRETSRQGGKVTIATIVDFSK